MIKKITAEEIRHAVGGTWANELIKSIVGYGLSNQGHSISCFDSSSRVNTYNDDEGRILLLCQVEHVKRYFWRAYGTVGVDIFPNPSEKTKNLYAGFVKNLKETLESEILPSRIIPQNIANDLLSTLRPKLISAIKAIEDDLTAKHNAELLKKAEKESSVFERIGSAPFLSKLLPHLESAI